MNIAKSLLTNRTIVLCAVQRRCFSAGANPARQLSLQPVAIGAVVEATKRLKPPAMDAMRRIMEKLKLTVNEDKTHLCLIPQERFDFLGYTFGRCYNRVTGRAYIGTRPSKKSIKRMVESITEETNRRRTILDADYVVGRLNRKLTGWANYFCLGQVSTAYQSINTHVTQRLRRWLCKKHKVQGKGGKRYSYQYLYDELGLINLPRRTHDLPWAKA